ncbi:hypothetical protein [Carboxylicivirga linearis]|uniref:Uncharacterized protein n=1 Tax=Carboxylicivirga linearis TaxID=1628157 RepID=A0ABS5JTZ2_9BACT|nr:hypothetical protein [Carboxylicivirga linearis]MBS2098288.1 hypothetical protein [Carboxylicivirga linearis]
MRIGFFVTLFCFIHSWAIDAQFLDRWHQNSIDKRLIKMEERLKEKPIELGANLQLLGDKIYLVTNDDKWFRRAMRPRKSGFKLKILSETYNPCSFNNNSIGYLKKTEVENILFRNIRKSKSRIGQNTDNAYFLIDLPEELLAYKNDFNLMFTIEGKGRNYNSYAHPWGYAPFFNETYTIDSKDKIKHFLNSFRHKAFVEYDTLEVNVPFNASSDTLYWRKIDSDFIFKMGTATSVDSAVIRSYASVDGDKSSNLVLARRRGENIISFLHEFGLDTSKVNLQWAENWELFRHQYKEEGIIYFDRLTQKEIKTFFTDSLKHKHWQKRLDAQRSSKIKLFCSTKHPVMLLSDEELVDNFNKATANKKYESAEIILHEMWNRIIVDKYSVPPIDILQFYTGRKSEALEKKHLWLLHLYEREISDCSLSELVELMEIQPRDPEVNYWYIHQLLIHGRIGVDKTEQLKLEREIKRLRRYKVPVYYSSRLLMNFYIKAASQAHINGQYKLKSYYMNNVYNLARHKFKDEKDLTEVAAFCSLMYYSEYGRKLLHKIVFNGQYNQQMLEAFVWMTLYKKDYYLDTNYQLLVKIVAETNPGELLKMFQSSTDGGIAFFLLDHPYYRSLYCKCLSNESPLLSTKSNKKAPKSN